METILLVVHVVICIALIGVVLIQRSESDGFGLGSGSGANLLSGRSTANLLTRTTAFLATLFIINSLVLSILVTRGNESSLLDTIAEQEETGGAPAVPTDAPAAEATQKETKKPVVPEAE